MLTTKAETEQLTPADAAYRSLMAELDRAARERPGTVPTTVLALAYHLGQLCGLERRAEPRAAAAAEAAR